MIWDDSWIVKIMNDIDRVLSHTPPHPPCPQRKRESKTESEKLQNELRHLYLYIPSVTFCDLQLFLRKFGKDNKICKETILRVEYLLLLLFEMFDFWCKVGKVLYLNLKIISNGNAVDYNFFLFQITKRNLKFWKFLFFFLHVINSNCDSLL